MRAYWQWQINWAVFKIEVAWSNPYLSAAKHDTKNVCLHNVDQLSICIVAQHTVFVAVGARIVYPAAISGKTAGLLQYVACQCNANFSCMQRAKPLALCSRPPKSHGGLASDECCMLGA